MLTSAGRTSYLRGIPMLALLVGATVATPGALAATSPGPVGVEGISVRLVELPQSSLSDPLARTYIAGSVAAGQSMRSKVEVSNTSRKPWSVSIYTAAARMRNGAFVFADGHTSNELAHWTHVSQSALRLAPGQAAVVTVDVRVPEKASGGERYSVVWAAVDAPSQTASVNLVNRVGVRMYVRVGSSVVAARYSVSRPKASRSAAGSPLVTATVRNTGTSTIAVAGTLTLSHGPGGLRAGPFRFTLVRPLAPGASGQVRVHLTRQLPRGPWRARLELQSGATQHASGATISFAAPVRSGA